MQSRCCWAFGLLCVLAGALVAGEVKLARHPSYHAGKIAFSYVGDIWVVNEDGASPRRITDHSARDVYPRFSPDGQWIAFSSNRYGNYDVFVIPAASGTARRLTYHTGNDLVVGWSRDGQRVVFQAARGRLFPGIPNLYEVPLEGGLEQSLATDWGYWGSYSPDGKQLAFNRHPMVWWRKHYRGSYAADLWVMDVAARRFRKLLDDGTQHNRFWPMWGNGEIFFVADRLANEKNVRPGSPDVLKSVNNIWKMPARGGEPVQVTRHTSGNLFWPSISSDGKVIVYEENFGLWKMDTASGRPTEVKVRIETDDKENPVETVAVNSEADSYDLSPSTRRAVISARGELFTIATERGDITRLAESQSRETSPRWSPDGKWIAFVSDRSGRDEVWISDPLGKDLKKLSDSDTEKAGLEWAPDSKSLLYAGSDRKLYRVTVPDEKAANGKTEVVAASDVGRIALPQFSPDGRWISYTRPDRNQRPHVYIAPAGGGQERHIADDDTFSESGAVWTRDGKSLLFISGVMQGGIATARQTTAQLWILPLLKEEKNPAERDIDDEAAAASAESAERPRGPGAGGGRPAAEAKPPEVKIEWDGLSRRARRLVRLGDNISGPVPSPDSRSVAFVASGESDGRFSQAIYVTSMDGQRLTRVAQAARSEGDDGPPTRFGFFGGGLGSLAYSKDGRTLFYREGRGIYAVEVGGGTVPSGGVAAAAAESGTRGPGASFGRSDQRRRLSFTARVEVDHRAVRRQVFQESWRIMKHRFYDPNMHGVDWERIKAVYEPLLDSAADQEELHNIVSQMIGELNASHTGISGGFGRGGRDEGGLQTRYPGFELEADPSGYYKVSHVYKDGPADHDYIKIRAGDFVLAIDDQDLKAGDNYWKHYTAGPGRKFKFLVNSKPAKEGAWETRVEPVGGQQYTTLQYQKWVAERKAMVDKLSGGEIGYLHIRQMNAESLRQFERDLVENHFKKALVIDQRFNPGGGIDQELLQILQQRQYQYTRSRDSVEVTRPQRGFFGPMVVMQNERSTSDAEVFPQGFKDLKLGKVVGVPTYGAVIGTGSYTLMDGSAIRTPGTGLWTVRGENLENYGVRPDIHVDNTPEDFLQGRDAQLEKAVEVLKEELKKRG